MIRWYRKRRLRWAAKILADHIVIEQRGNPVIGVDCARNDIDTIVVAVTHDMHVQVSEQLRAAYQSVPR